MTSTALGVDFIAKTYDASSSTYQFDFDPDGNVASMAVVAALSEVTETAPWVLDPLQNAIDTDALDVLLGHEDDETGNTLVTFTAVGYAITLHSEGVVELTAVANGGPGVGTNGEPNHD